MGYTGEYGKSEKNYHLLNICCCCWVASVVSDSVWPHRQQPTRLPHPWDSPGKNTGVGCHFLLQCMKVKSESEVTQSCPTHCDPMDCSLPGFSVCGIFQARVLVWVAIAFCFASHYKSILVKWKLKLLSCVQLFATSWTIWSEVRWSEVAQSCPTLCDPMDCSLPGSSLHGILQARVLE